MKCQTMASANGGIGGSIIVGCGSEPCRCAEINQEMERVFGQSRAESIAELEAELADADNLPEPPDDGMTAMERWLS